MAQRPDDPAEYLTDEQVMAELDRAMAEYIAMEKALEAQMPQLEATSMATAKMMDHFMRLALK